MAAAAVAKAALRSVQAHGRGAFTAVKGALVSTGHPVKVGAAGGLLFGCAGAQAAFGSADHFYDHRFTTTANPNDLAEFYGNEDFMEIFCVFPFMVDFMMRSGHFDDAGHVHTFGLPGSMEVSMQFEEYEEDTTGDGENDTVTCFNKQERFHDTLFGFPMWDMVQNFGFKSNGDGTTEVYHYGERIRAPFPIRLIFQIHAMYVIWATEQHVNSELFGADDEHEDEEIAQRHNIPFHVMGEFLGGLTEDVETQLVKLRAKPRPEDEEAVSALTAQVAELEETLAKLKEAQLRRADTSVVSRVTTRKSTLKGLSRRPTLLARRPTVEEAAARAEALGEDEAIAERAAADAELERAVRRTATRAKLALQVEDDDVHETISAAVAMTSAGDAANPAAALQRRLTSLYQSSDVHSAAFASEDAADAAAARAAPDAQQFTSDLESKRADALARMASRFEPAVAPAAPVEAEAAPTPLTQLQEAAPAPVVAAVAAPEVAAVAAAAPAPVVAAVAAPAVAAKQAATPTNFAANMIRRATLNMAAELANEGHRVTVEKNTFHPDGYKMEETKMTFHPKSGVEPKVAGSASVIAGSPGKK